MVMEEELEESISKIILKKSLEDWLDFSSCDVVIVGAGPSGLTAAKYLAENGLKTVVFERRLTFGGGISGGGMLFHKVVVEKDALDIIKEFKIKYEESGVKGLYVVSASELVAKLASGAIDAGARIIHGVTVEDVIFRRNPIRIVGVVVQWSAVFLAGLHVDPLFVKCKAVVDATGHDAEVLNIVSKRIHEVNLKLKGHESAYAIEGEKSVVERTGRVIPGLYATGMAVATLYGLPRMGPIIGGMLLSGKRVAEVIIKDLKG